MSSQPCGSLDFIDGGVIRNASILNSQMTDSRLSNCILDACDITNLRSIDAPSAETIVNAIAALPADALTALINAILSKLTVNPDTLAVVPMANPKITAVPDLPTTMIGDRAEILGKPQVFAKFGSYIVPLYREGL